MLKPLEYLSKNIAWNGVSLEIPMVWEIDSLDTTHMLIGEDESPRIELKWTEAPKKFTLEAYLKRFISRSRKSLGIKIRELPTPEFFSHPVKHFEFFFFSWESMSSNGKGTFVFCSHCKRLTLIRFFFNSRIKLNSLPALILNSFTDHPMAEQTQWNLFGLNFSTPRSFRLMDYSFKPGCYVIRLSHKKTRLTIFSWGPASFLLSGTSLSEFATQRLPQIKGLAKTGVCIRGNYLEWSYRQGRFKNAHRLPFLNRYAVFILFRICHDRQNNRILGVMADSPKGFDHELIKGSMIGDG